MGAVFRHDKRRGISLLEASLEVRFFVFGGNDADGFNLYTGQKYNIVTDTWSDIADNPHFEHPWSHPEGVEELTGAALNGKLYVFGAYGGLRIRQWILRRIQYNQMYDPAADTWTPLAPKPTTTASSVAVAYDNKIYLFGGYYWDESLIDNIEYTIIEVYDPATDEWNFAGRNAHVDYWYGNRRSWQFLPISLAALIWIHLSLMKKSWPII